MNIVINPHKFNSQCIFFLDKKKNNIINGCFSKIIYSTECFTMNGIFVVIPLISKSPNLINNTTENAVLSRDDLSSRYIETSDNKYTVYFYTHDVNNLQYITIISEIENAIINTYKEMNGVKKRSNLVLTQQLYRGFFKIYKEKQNCKSTTDMKYMLKISGVWENTEEVGITYKFIEIYDNK
uniref:Uncharacterized protein n=1 Tax=viral metagenome TaxID=1070528 RepID=A0A6C0HGS6_9ZZZZ